MSLKLLFVTVRTVTLVQTLLSSRISRQKLFHRLCSNQGQSSPFRVLLCISNASKDYKARSSIKRYFFIGFSLNILISNMLLAFLNHRYIDEIIYFIWDEYDVMISKPYILCITYPICVVLRGHRHTAEVPTANSNQYTG